jgi:hypothetical protein
VGVGIYQGKILLYAIAVELKMIKSPKKWELGMEKTSVVETILLTGLMYFGILV